MDPKGTGGRVKPLRELRRMPLPRTRVNKRPVCAPNPSGWHYGCCCQRFGEECWSVRRWKLLCRRRLKRTRPWCAVSSRHELRRTWTRWTTCSLPTSSATLGCFPATSPTVKVQADDRRVFRYLLQPQVHRRGAGSRSRQGGFPLHRARHPRSKGASGRRAYRQGDNLQSHLHPPHRRGKIAEERSLGTWVAKYMGQRLEQEERERELIG
jgi:hypothetical protein